MRTKHVFNPGIEGREAMMWRGVLRHQQTKGITLITETGLNAHENIAKLPPQDMKLLAIG